MQYLCTKQTHLTFLEKNFVFSLKSVPHVLFSGSSLPWGQILQGECESYEQVIK
jgi:hypothetical protein